MKTLLRCLLVSAALVSAVSAEVGDKVREQAQEKTPGKLQITLHRNAAPKARERFEVTGFAERDWQGQAAAELFAVYVHTDSEHATPLFGEYRVTDGRIQFEPRFSLRTGLAYRAVLQLPGKKPVVQLFKIPREARHPTAKVVQVYPTQQLLPENQLKFYIHFSEPMSRGGVYRHIHLYKRSGEEVEYPFLELDQELWDRSGKRFTLFFDPGRVKRGLRPREEVGPALVEGGEYRLVVDKEWLDKHGVPMQTAFVKHFRVEGPDYDQPRPQHWKLEIPASGTKHALRLHFDEALDHAMLQRVITVATGSDQVAGAIEIDKHETRLSFQPDRPWQAGNYTVVVETTLEDLAGNSVAKPFEVDVFRTFQSQVTSAQERLPFQVK